MSLLTIVIFEGIAHPAECRADCRGSALAGILDKVLLVIQLKHHILCHRQPDLDRDCR